MEEVIGSLIAQWGAAGILLGAAGYIVYDGIKTYKSKGNIESKIDNLVNNVNDIKSELPQLSQRMDWMEKSVNDKFDIYTDRVDRIESKIDKQPACILEQINLQNIREKDRHNTQMINQINLAPVIHNILDKYRSRINCDHMVLGIFHNGTSSITGIPFYKFDIVAEKFNPHEIERDVEFAHMYKDVDILRHNKLPVELVQNNRVYYKINEDGTSELSTIDDILYRRLLGRDIKQITFNILKDDSNNPMGFVGCIKYDYDPFNFDEFESCVEEIENAYSKI